jgi:hypothetical protein
MVAMIDFECGQKRLRLAHFDDDPGELVGAARWSLPSQQMDQRNFTNQTRCIVSNEPMPDRVRNVACHS